jgi:GNAT superfamily N-acetyltransferase
VTAPLRIKTGPLKSTEVEEAGRIVRLAFGTFLGLPNPLDFMGDRDLMSPRYRSKNVKVIAARDGGRLIGSNVVTRWGSFGFFGPLTVLPEYWDRGVAQQLMEATIKVFDSWGVHHSGLFTFPNSPKHIGLYQKFGFWPRSLTALMGRTPDANSGSAVMLSEFRGARRAEVIDSCRKLTGKILKGLDLSDEIRSVIAQGTGEVVLSYDRNVLTGFAICHTGAGSEGGAKSCYVKFAAAKPGAGARENFEKLLAACDAFAHSRGVNVEAGVNLAREDAYKAMRSHGYRVNMLGVAMLRPNGAAFNRPDAFVIDDWR